VAWPDERLDDLAGRMDAGFERVDGEIAALRAEMNERFERVDDRFVALQTEMNARFERMHGVMLRMWVTVAIGLLGIVGALLAAAVGSQPTPHPAAMVRDSHR
jgi:hypothetical protein